MNVRRAKDLARQWVLEHASEMPGFLGAFFHGSTNWLPDTADLPATSDVDVMVVFDDPVPSGKPGKFRYEGVILEISYLSSDDVRSPEQVLGRYDLAGSFRTPGIILDPSGRLTALQAVVAQDYAKRHWVRRRCEDARDRVRRYLASFDPSAPLYDQVTSCLFAAGVLVHILLVAGLKNPTVRTRYVAARSLLADHGRLDAYEAVLALLGCADMSRERAELHLTALAAAFDAAKRVVRTPFFFAADISDVARPVAIDGSRELIARGLHREAVFWMLATASRCQMVFAHDAPELLERHAPGYQRFLADLGIASSEDRKRRVDEVEAALPWVWDLAESIMAANPAIED